MYRLIVMVKRGTAANLPEIWTPHETLDAARAAGRTLSRNERVGHVLITRDGVPPTFVEWVA